MSLTVYLIAGLVAVVLPLAVRGWRQSQRQLTHYRRLAERQGLIAESLFGELAAVRSDLAWVNTRHEATSRLVTETCWELRLETGELRFSTAWKAALGYDQADLPPALGTFELLLHPDDRRRVIDRLQRFRQTSEAILEVNYRLRHRDGHFLEFQCRAARVAAPDGKSEVLFAVQHGTSAASANPLDLEAMATRTLLRDGSLVLVAWNGDGRIEQSNDRAESILGWSRTALSTTRFFDLFSAPDAERFRIDCERLSTGASVSRTAVTRTGAGVPIVLHWITWVRPGKHTGFVSIGLELPPLPADGDESGRHHNEAEQIGLLHHTLSELKAPLTMLVAQTRAALRDNLSPKQRKHLEIMAGATDQIRSVTDKLLALSLCSADRRESGGKSFVLDQCLMDCCDSVLQPCRDRGLHLRLQVAPEVPQDLAGESTQLAQILVRLLEHAVKRTQHGWISLAVALGQRRGARVKLEFTVADSGLGIDNRHNDSLSLQLFPPGPGLAGLAVARHLVRNLGGKLTVESAPGAGTHIGFGAWFACLSDQASYHLTLPSAARTCRALVVDTDPDLAPQLRHLGIHADTARADDALELINAADLEPYRLVFLGWQPPLIDGISLAAQMRAVTPAVRTPWLIIVAGATLQEVETALGDLPVDGVLTAPVTGLHLANLIAGLVAEPPPDAVQRLLSTPNRDLTGLRVLLLEDSDTSQLIATELLRDAGAEVTVADTGESAFALLTGTPIGTFDVVLMDIEIPEVDSLETCRSIRATGRFPDLPMIAMAGRRSDESLQRYLAAGIDDFIAKPLNPQHLCNVLAHWTKPLLRTQHRTARTWINPAGRDQPVYARLRGINTAVGLEFMSNKPSLYERVLKDFHARFKHAPSHLRDALARGDYVQARRQVHALKSLAGSIGAVELHATAVDLESALAESNPPTSGVLEALEEALAEVLNGLREQFLTD